MLVKKPIISGDGNTVEPQGLIALMPSALWAVNMIYTVNLIATVNLLETATQVQSITSSESK